MNELLYTERACPPLLEIVAFLICAAEEPDIIKPVCVLFEISNPYEKIEEE
jgi:hypothetical protein